MQNPPDMPPTVTTLNGFKVRFGIATEQWPSRCSNIRTDLSHQALHPSSNLMPLPNETETQFSSKQGRTTITNHSGIRLTSKNNSNSWWSQSVLNDKLISTIPASWSFLLQERNKNDARDIQTNFIHPPSLMNIREQKLKLSKPRMGGTGSKLLFLIG